MLHKLSLVVTILVIFWTASNASCEGLSSNVQHEEWYEAKMSWKLQHLSKAEAVKVSNITSLPRIWNIILPHILYPRTPGSQGSARARGFITTVMRDILGWNVEYDTFVAFPPFPYRPTTFSNIIATHNPKARRRLILACHYDTKITPRGFVGATDSAVPCSIMMEVAVALRDYLRNSKGKNDLTLQFIFFDGEEAFLKWSSTDSLYGSRHLANLWQNTPWPLNETSTTKNKLDSIDLLAVLDLLGAPAPKFYNNDVVKSKNFEDLIRIEKLLYGANSYFQQQILQIYVADDHIPFFVRNVSILHVIPQPFPRVWHTLQDNIRYLDRTAIKKLSAIFSVFVAEYLHLNIS